MKALPVVLAALAFGSCLGALAQSKSPSLPPTPPTLRLRSVSVGRQSLPGLDVDGVVTGVSLGTTSSGGLTQTVSGLITQDVELPSLSGEKVVVKTYAGSAVREITLFNPASDAWADSTGSQDQENLPYICGASAPGQPANANPGSAPQRDGGYDPNPLDAKVVAAGTMFESRPYASSGGATGTPLQLVPFPGRYLDGSLAQGVSLPNCGTNLNP